MGTQFATSVVKGTDSYLAGKEAAQLAYNKLKNPEVDLAVLFCSNDYDHSAVMRGIQTIIGEHVPIVGCTSAGQFNEEKVEKDGISCALISSDTHVFYTGVGTQLKEDPILAVQNAIQAFPQEVEGHPYQAAMLFVDGLAGKGEETVLAASSLLGPLVRFVGGAAADNLAFKETHIFSDGHALSDALAVCLTASRRPIIISVKHGHVPISPPLTITKAKGNILYEIEGKPALEVWKYYLADLLRAKGIEVENLNQKELSQLLLKYEAGLMTGEDYKIRFPASCNPDGSFNFVCSIMEGSVIKIMGSEKEDQIRSAREAAELALRRAKGVKLAGAIIFDCACRAMILQEQFEKAVATNKQVLGSLPFLGCETYGEIAMELGQLSGFHNTTTVLMLFPD